MRSRETSPDQSREPSSDQCRRESGAGLTHPLKPAFKPLWTVFRDALPARAHVVVDHFRAYGKLPNLKHPTTFSEKIAHRKLYDRDPGIPPLVDKIAAKDLLAARFGPEFVVPTLATFTSETEVDFAALTYPCVLKASHGSGMNIFLMQPPADEIKMRHQLRRFLRHDHYKTSEEWAYSQVPKRLLAEPLLAGGDDGLIDYKFHTFQGLVFAIQVDLDRHTNHTRFVMRPDWTRMPVAMTFPPYRGQLPPPAGLEQMIRYAQQIGAAFSYVRVDLYQIGDSVKFSEATFYPGAGILETFDPPEYDAIFGAQWK